jgi:pimeloyl-ACP methyl ester carboxylesterase
LATVDGLVVPGGHSPHLEQAETVVDAIAAFARGLP